MKRFFMCIMLVLAIGTSAMAATDEGISVTPLDSGTFVIVRAIDGGSVVELMAVRDNKLVILDSYRYIRKNEFGGEFSIEFDHAKKIKAK